MTKALDALSAALPGVAIHVRRNRKTLLGLRGHHHGLHLTLHPVLVKLLEDPERSVLIKDWVDCRGRNGTGADLRTLLREARKQITIDMLATTGTEIAAEPTLGEHVDLERELEAMHQTWFADLPRPVAAWARQSPKRGLTSIRFGCYRRLPAPSLSLNPRLARPWIARVFFEHVLFHELCHHRQALAQLWRREMRHGPRFRAWERAFPGHQRALAWERAAVGWMLDDQPPPWYTTRQIP